MLPSMGPGACLSPRFLTRPPRASRGPGGGRGSAAQAPHVAHDLGGSSRAGEGAGARRPLAKRAEPPAGPRLGAEEAGPARSPRRARNPGLGGGQEEKALPPGQGRGLTNSADRTMCSPLGIWGLSPGQATVWIHTVSLHLRSGLLVLYGPDLRNPSWVCDIVSFLSRLCFV